MVPARTECVLQCHSNTISEVMCNVKPELLLVLSPWNNVIWTILSTHYTTSKTLTTWTCSLISLSQIFHSVRPQPQDLGAQMTQWFPSWSCPAFLSCRRKKMLTCKQWATLLVVHIMCRNIQKVTEAQNMEQQMVGQMWTIWTFYSTEGIQRGNITCLLLKRQLLSLYGSINILFTWINKNVFHHLSPHNLCCCSFPFHHHSFGLTYWVLIGYWQ